MGNAGEMTDFTKQTWKSIRQLLVIAALMITGYTCVKTLRFSTEPLNFIFVCAFFAIPLLAIRPVLRFPHRPKVIGLILLIPLLSLSSCSLLFTVACNRPGTSIERTNPLQDFQQGNCTIRLFKYEYGGALGVHGIVLEQRRPIVRGLYMIRTVAFFDSAKEGTLSVEGPDKVRVHARGNYDSNDYEIEQVYTLKPWVYF
jgi:hypothetical protein